TDPASRAAGETFGDAGGTLFATGIGAPDLPLETAAAGGEPCRLGVGAAADGFEGAAGIEAASLGGTVDEFAASLAAGAGGCGGGCTAGGVAHGGAGSGAG